MGLEARLRTPTRFAGSWTTWRSAAARSCPWRPAIRLDLSRSSRRHAARVGWAARRDRHRPRRWALRALRPGGQAAGRAARPAALPSRGPGPGRSERRGPRGRCRTMPATIRRCPLTPAVPVRVVRDEVSDAGPLAGLSGRPGGRRLRRPCSSPAVTSPTSHRPSSDSWSGRSVRLMPQSSPNTVARDPCRLSCAARPRWPPLALASRDDQRSLRALVADLAPVVVPERTWRQDRS